MPQNPPCSVIEVQRLSGDLIVIFNDNRCGLYPAHMLYEMLDVVEVKDAYDADEEFAPLPPEQQESRPLQNPE